MLADVERAAERYAAARGILKGRMEALRRSLDDTTRAVLPMIQAGAAEAESARSALEAEIRNAAGDFRKPKTRTCAGVKVGFRLGRSTVDWGEDTDVLARIREHLPEDFEQLVKTTEKPVSAALAALPEAKRDLLHVRVKQGDDEVVIRPADGSMDKELDALLADAARLEGGAS